MRKLKAGDSKGRELAVSCDYLMPEAHPGPRFPESLSDSFLPHHADSQRFQALVGTGITCGFCASADADLVGLGVGSKILRF